MKIKLVIFVLMTLTLLTVSTAVVAQTGEVEFNGGEALKNLANNNAVVGILYSLVFVEATVIAFLWRRLDKLNDKLLKSYEERLEREENLYSQISRLNTEIELIKQRASSKK
jgi:hypothetical protein